MTDFDNAQIFWIVEIDIFHPGSGTQQEGAQVWGAFAWGSLGIGDEEVPEAHGLLRVSDSGYLTHASDPGGVILYRPRLDRAIDIDRQFDIDPLGYGFETSWGSARLLNPDGLFDWLSHDVDTDGRRVRVGVGLRTWDRKRQVHLDPPYDRIQMAFLGSAGPMEMDEDAILVPLRDRSYLLDKLWQEKTYGGTGARDGTEELAGLPKPRLRGGTPQNPVRNVTPILVDPVAMIWQVSDGPGTIETVYQRGYGGDIAFQGTTGNLYAGSTNPGYFRYESSDDGLYMQLGSPPEGEITVDATGRFPGFGPEPTVGVICGLSMLVDLGLSQDDIDVADWLALDQEYGYQGGIYTGTEERQAIEVIGEILAGVGARLLAGRTGRLRPYVLPSPEGMAPEATYTDAQIVRVTPIPLPESVLPAVWQVRVGYGRNHTIQIADLAAAVSDSRRQWLAQEWRYGRWEALDAKAHYHRPTEITLPSILTRKTDAEHVAARLGAIWGAGRRIYDVELWQTAALYHEIGSVITLQYPVAGLRNGRRGVIVGEQLRAGEHSLTIRVLT